VFYEQWLAIARETGDIVGVAEASFNIALFHQDENPTKALKYAREAHRIFSEIGHQQYTAEAQLLIEQISGSG